MCESLYVRQISEERQRRCSYVTVEPGMLGMLKPAAFFSLSFIPFLSPTTENISRAFPISSFLKRCRGSPGIQFRVCVFFFKKKEHLNWLSGRRRGDINPEDNPRECWNQALMGRVGIKVDLILGDQFQLLRHYPPPPSLPRPFMVGVNTKSGGKIRATKAISAFPKSGATSGNGRPPRHPNGALMKPAQSPALRPPPSWPRDSGGARAEIIDLK